MPNLVRYCYECGSIGSAPADVKDCCPDGSHAVMVPPQVATQAQFGFFQSPRAISRTGRRSKLKYYSIRGELNRLSLMGLVQELEKLGATEYEIDQITNLNAGEMYTFGHRLPLKPVTRLQ